MKRTFLHLFFLAIFTSACTGTQAVINETWTLVKLVTKGERTDTVTEIVEVHHCGIPERKTTSCSAGTSNDISVSFGGGIQFGQGFSGSIDTDVMLSLGIGRESSESVELEAPPSGAIYRYTVSKTYNVLVGKVLARSSLGDEKEAEYAFHARCSIEIQPTLELQPCNPILENPQAISTMIPIQPTIFQVWPTFTPTLECDILPNGECVSPESLSRIVGGNANYWTKQGHKVWRYMNKGANATFRHPGGNVIITYWWGFPEPTNLPSDCVIKEINYGGPTRSVQCLSAGATFSADGVGLHLP